jgi:hypothetical protein
MRIKAFNRPHYYLPHSKAWRVWIGVLTLLNEFSMSGVSTRVIRNGETGSRTEHGLQC